MGKLLLLLLVTALVAAACASEPRQPEAGPVITVADLVTTSTVEPGVAQRCGPQPADGPVDIGTSETVGTLVELEIARTVEKPAFTPRRELQEVRITVGVDTELGTYYQWRAQPAMPDLLYYGFDADAEVVERFSALNDLTVEYIPVDGVASVVNWDELAAASTQLADLYASYLGTDTESADLLYEILAADPEPFIAVLADGPSTFHALDGLAIETGEQTHTIEYIDMYGSVYDMVEEITIEPPAEDGCVTIDRWLTPPADENIGHIVYVVDPANGHVLDLRSEEISQFEERTDVIEISVVRRGL